MTNIEDRLEDLMLAETGPEMKPAIYDSIDGQNEVTEKTQSSVATLYSKAKKDLTKIRAIHATAVARKQQTETVLNGDLKNLNDTILSKETVIFEGKDLFAL